MQTLHAVPSAPLYALHTWAQAFIIRCRLYTWCSVCMQQCSAPCCALHMSTLFEHMYTLHATPSAPLCAKHTSAQRLHSSTHCVPQVMHLLLSYTSKHIDYIMKALHANSCCTPHRSMHCQWYYMQSLHNTDVFSDCTRLYPVQIINGHQLSTVPVPIQPETSCNIEHNVR